MSRVSKPFAEIELEFARSRRRAVARRRPRRRRSPLALRSVRAGGLALGVLALLAESRRLEASNAKPPLRRAPQGAPCAQRAPCRRLSETRSKLRPTRRACRFLCSWRLPTRSHRWI